MNIQWYPGHMTRARRNMTEDIRLVDVVIELLDARAPISTQNPDIRRITKNVKRLIILNKADLADRSVTSAWISYFRDQGAEVIAMDSRSRQMINLVSDAIERLTASKRSRDLSRGIIGKRAVKALVCGIPNVGKSTFINSIIKKSSAKTGDMPGVTRGTQWLAVNDGLILLDTPGILWPKFSDERIGMHLAEIGAISDNVFNQEELAIDLLAELMRSYPELLMERYHMTEDEISEAEEKLDTSLLLKDRRSLAVLGLIGIKRHAVKKGAAVDYERAAAMLIDDLRSGRIGRISLEKPKYRIPAAEKTAADKTDHRNNKETVPEEEI